MNSDSKIEVSVVTAVYNAEKYIADSIQSVLAQAGNWEHILVNDGSTDNSEKIIKKLKHPKARYFYQKNKGPAEARNLGLKYATGKYIINLDADDLLAKGALETKRTYLENHPEKDLVFGKLKVMNDEGSILYSIKLNAEMKKWSSSELLAWLVREHIISDCQPMWRAAPLKSLKGYKKIPGEDIEILIHALVKGFQFGFVDKVTGHYRLSPGSLSR